MTRGSSARITVTVIVLALVVAATLAFRGVGRWLVREDALGRADVIVVLSGSMPMRAEEAGRIFQMGDAREVWITRAESPAAELQSLSISYTSEAEYSREVLIREGVPEADVRILPDTIIDTEDEVREISREMRQQGLTTAILVTSPPHTRRVRTLWRKLARPDQRLTVRAAYQDRFDANHWWRNTHDAFAVVREMMGLLNAWLGLPVRPHRS
jgi:uncharacterized SAM-binding protein YcdF (DUF218 family)